MHIHRHTYCDDRLTSRWNLVIRNCLTIQISRAFRTFKFSDFMLVFLSGHAKFVQMSEIKNVFGMTTMDTIILTPSIKYLECHGKNYSKFFFQNCQITSGCGLLPTICVPTNNSQQNLDFYPFMRNCLVMIILLFSFT